MFIDSNILPNLDEITNKEKVLFAVKSSRKYRLKESLILLGVSILWLMIDIMFFVFFFLPIIQGQEVTFMMNQEQTKASLSNLQPLLVPTVIIGIFLLLGIGLLIYAFCRVLAKGEYFIGTSSGIIIYNPKKSRTTIPWSELNGNIQIIGDNAKATLIIEMKTGKTVENNGETSYVPNSLYIADIAGANEIVEAMKGAMGPLVS